ncbi:cyclic GMP-AMP synthase-like receptor 1 [Magallana gigas]|uniref:cyclic GMP-AMP synthase-like receptor 1 n=1 Tax=Magallana gigas TaxID=29159 RepID=UPI00333E3E86
MAVDNQDQEINKLLNALGFEKSVCHIRQNMVAALELTKNACLDSEFSCIYTGSLAEGFSGNYYSKISRADFDIMFIFNRFPYIVDEDKTQDDAPNNFQLVARVCHNSVRQGYAKLELITVKVPSKLHLAVKFEDRLFLSGLKTLSSLMRINRKLLGFIREEEVLGGVQFERHGPASSVTIESKEEGYAKRDLVYGHRCQFWPKCAQNWITRRRNWPENADVINAAKLGCHLVPTGFPGSKTEELEWRYSFVKPERHIMWFFNDCQRKCFALLKILNKENLASHFDTEVLTSYHFKTTLLWVLEETDDPDWSDKDLLKHVKTCLVKLMTFIKSRHCPHYFIEHANLFDREIFKDETCGKLSKILDSVLEDPYTALRSCPTFQTLINDFRFPSSMSLEFSVVLDVLPTVR